MNDDQAERLLDLLVRIHNDFLSRFKAFSSDLEKYVIWLTSKRG